MSRALAAIDRSIGLNVVEVRFRLNEDLEVQARDDRVCAPSIARDRNRNLGAPPQYRRETPLQTPQQCEVPAIADGLPVRVQTHSQLEAKDCGDLRGKVDPQGT